MEYANAGISASFYNLLLIETMEVRDACGATMLVVGDFATPMPGEVMLLTADFIQVMNNSAIDNCCLLVYKADN